ncbi:MAG: HNH endonuclease [Zetaproteobacteria bacterium]|nr:HNH endonuclease [Zetaproteobacteria bacterium]
MDELFVKKERAKARELRKSRWWQNKIAACVCHYCATPLSKTEVTMDHLVPISRGGRSTKGNVVPCCKPCNNQKQASTPVEMILASLR